MSCGHPEASEKKQYKNNTHKYTQNTVVIAVEKMGVGYGTIYRRILRLPIASTMGSAKIGRCNSPSMADESQPDNKLSIVYCFDVINNTFDKIEEVLGVDTIIKFKLFRNMLQIVNPCFGTLLRDSYVKIYQVTHLNTTGHQPKLDGNEPVPTPISIYIKNPFRTN